MTELWAGAVALILLAGLFLLYPAVSRSYALREDRKAQNVAIYQEQSEELKLDLERGKLDQSEYDNALEELKRKLISDAQTDVEAESKQQKMPFLLGGFVTIVVTVATYWALGGYQQVKEWNVAQQRLPEFARRAVMEQGEPLKVEEMRAFALALRTKLATEGGDPVAWLLLGRVSLALQDTQMASEALERSLKLNPSSLGAHISYAQTLVLMNDENSILQAGKVLDRARQLAPGNIDVVSLSALVSFQLGLNEKAARDWRWLLTQLPSDDPRYQLVKDNLGKLTGETVESLHAQNSQMTETAPAVEVTAEPSAAEVGALTVRITASEQALTQAHTLFVFATVPGGSRMPVAVKKIANPSLPIEITLSDGDAMMPTAKLSMQKQVEITALMSKDGNVGRSAGEWTGISQVIDMPHSSLINIEVNQEVVP